jgi:outer membrane immunogenic protein
MAGPSKVTALLGAFSFVAFSAFAHAADAVLEAPVRAGFNWTGFHVGAAVGAGAFLADSEIVYFQSGDGIFGEISLGYDHMLSDRFLLGAFADMRYGGQEATLGQGPIDLTFTQTYGFDVGLRAGYLLNPYSLGYVLGGYSWQRFKIEEDMRGEAREAEIDDGGFTVGAGMETVIGGNWTLTNEYRYASYAIDDDLSDVDFDTHTYRIGVNYRFGADGGAEATLAVPAFNWTGFYVGAQVGVVADIDEVMIVSGITTLDGVGGEGGWASLNVGYDHEFGGMWVVGVQAGARYMSVDTNFEEIFPLYRDYGFDLLARIGVKVNESTLAYAIGGYTHQYFDFDIQHVELDWDDGGYTIGAGLETAVTNNLALNVEYRFSQFDDHDPLEALLPGNIAYEPRMHTFGVGVKYKLN